MQYNVKDRLFQKEYRVVNRGSVLAPYLCGCDLCLSSLYGSCELFSECTLETGLLNKILLSSVPEIFQRLWDSSDLVSNNQIVAIAAENCSVNTVWFVYVIDIKYVHHLSNNIDGRLQSQWSKVITVSFMQLSSKSKW